MQVINPFNELDDSNAAQALLFIYTSGGASEMMCFWKIEEDENEEDTDNTSR
jgi:hypothetical protein